MRTFSTKTANEDCQAWQPWYLEREYMAALAYFPMFTHCWFGSLGRLAHEGCQVPRTLGGWLAETKKSDSP